MILDNINLNLLRVFSAVYKTKNMTLAAKELHMTQSGVSQNIKKLEDLLGTNLFDRGQKIIFPNYKAKILFEASDFALEKIGRSLQSLMGKDEVIEGVVNFAIPIEFGNNYILPLLAQFSKKYPDIKFKIRYGHVSQVAQKIKSGELDFAVVDSFNPDPSIDAQVIFGEVLELCCSQGYFDLIKGPVVNKKSFYEQLTYIDYVDDGALLCQWFRHHLRSIPKVELSASLMDVQGVSRLISAGMGLGILPNHAIMEINKKGDPLYIFKGASRPLYNEISFISLSEKTFSPAARVLREYFINCLKSQKNIKF